MSRDRGDTAWQERGDRTLGSLLRHLIELLDGDVQKVYDEAGLDYRPRYTPVMRIIASDGPSSIKTIARRGSLTHSAASQTVAEMQRRGLVEALPGDDGREKIVHLTGSGRALLPRLQRIWAATNMAADELSDEVGAPLGKVLAEAIERLQDRPFIARIRHASRNPAVQARP